jgi:hypothetical protein
VAHPTRRMIPNIARDVGTDSFMPDGPAYDR